MILSGFATLAGSYGTQADAGGFAFTNGDGS